MEKQRKGKNEYWKDETWKLSSFSSNIGEEWKYRKSGEHESKKQKAAPFVIKLLQMASKI